MSRQTSESISNSISSLRNTVESGNFLHNSLYLDKWFENIEGSVNESKQMKVKNCFQSMHSSRLILFENHHLDQLYYLWLESTQYYYHRSNKSIICLDSKVIKHPQTLMPSWKKILAEDYIDHYRYLFYVVKMFSKSGLKRNEWDSIQVQHFFDLNTYCFTSSRNLVLHLRMDVEALLKSEATFRKGKLRIKSLQQEKIWNTLYYLYQRLNHANRMSREKGYYQEIKKFAYSYRDLKNYKQIKDVFSYLDKIKDQIGKIRIEIENMLRSRKKNNQILVQFCEFIRKLQGPKNKNAQDLLFELQHFKTIYHIFRPTSQYKENLKKFISERMEQIRYVAFTEMKFKLKDSNFPQLLINTHGYRFQQLEQLFNYLSVAIIRWNINGELDDFIKPHPKNRDQSTINLKVQQGIGNHTDYQLTISQVLAKFKREDKQWPFAKWKLKIVQSYVKQDRKDILIIEMSLKKINLQDQAEFPFLIKQ